MIDLSSKTHAHAYTDEYLLMENAKYFESSQGFTSSREDMGAKRAYALSNMKREG